MGFLNKIFGLGTRDFAAEAPSTEVTDTFQKVKKSAHFLIEAAAEQSDAIHETMASLTEIRSMLAQTESQVARSRQVTDETQQHTLERLKTVERLQHAMNAIKDSNLLLGDLQVSFQVIKSKARVINDIVSKTQLLSFNASIEAARAGQFGKGFSVVAEEVGRLAQTSGHAAKEIEILLNESQLRAMSVVEMVVARANEGVVVTRDVKESFTGMAKSINEISLALTSMSEASREQTLGIERTTLALEKISATSLKIKANGEEILRTTNYSPVSSPTENLDPRLGELIENIEPHARAQLSVPTKGSRKLEADDPSFRAQK